MLDSLPEGRIVHIIGRHATAGHERLAVGTVEEMGPGEAAGRADRVVEQHVKDDDEDKAKPEDRNGLPDKGQKSGDMVKERILF